MGNLVSSYRHICFSAGNKYPQTSHLKASAKPLEGQRTPPSATTTESVYVRVWRGPNKAVDTIHDSTVLREEITEIL